ncbi:dihydropteroate synthase [Salinibacter sp. 10B]|uniref:dihydropteroate synthase n=1 Tax=Salinibacter sp. 10B TaxID=1923971 RepID=UPI000CF3C6D5|nr:dihydropteroate synthase [Salinibacter sp. 10B]
MPIPAHSTAPFAPNAFPADRFMLNCRGRSLDCRPGREDGPGVQVMGILNVTPDSFSDGGEFLAVEDAVSRAAEMLSEGASIIDVGGESTRPGAEPVPPEDEMDRVLPVVEALTDEFPDALLSIDTYKPEVARAALDAGAHILNDVTGLRHDPAMAEVAAAADAPLILMHSKGAPGDLTAPREYADVTAEVRDALAQSIEAAEAAGVDSIVIDPGFGFGKSHAENRRLINEIDELLTLDRPLLMGVSRKSTIGATLGSPDNPAPVEDRLFGSLGATAVGVIRGASIVRTHDVAATTEMLTVLNSTLHA